jgi:hypothetical protein
MLAYAMFRSNPQFSKMVKATVVPLVRTGIKTDRFVANLAVIAMQARL